MKRFRTAVLVVGLCVLGAAPVRAEIIVDSFNDSPATQTVTVSGAPLGFKSSFSSFLTPSAFGGERDLYVERTSDNMGSVTAEIGFSIPGALTYSSGGATTGNALLSWDGIDGVATLNPIGLGGIDFTEGGENIRFAVVATSDLGSTLFLTVYTDADEYSVASVVVPAGGPFSTLFVPFASFVTGAGAVGPASFTSVGAITMLISGSTPGVDVSVDLLLAHSPEPSSIILFGLGAAGIGLSYVRRKRALAVAV